jgi:hypothetical protein
MASAVLVTGVHREELGFGDHVAAALEPGRIDVLRIPQGLSNRPPGVRDRFYFLARHREMYLQLRQQLGRQYRLLIDLHTGINESGRCADVFCADEDFLARLAQRPLPDGSVRLVRIVPETEPADTRSDFADLDAHTFIPERLWTDASCLYVGLEVYLAREGDGEAPDWAYARRVIEAIRDCRGDA